MSSIVLPCEIGADFGCSTPSLHSANIGSDSCFRAISTSNVISCRASHSTEPKNLMTTLIMPSDYGMEMLVGSSPVLGSGFLSGSPFYSEYARCGPVWSNGGPVSCSSESVTTITAKSMDAYRYSDFTRLTDEPPVNSPVLTPFARAGSSRRSNRESGRRRKVASVIPPPLQNLKPCIVCRPEEVPVSPDGLSSPTREKKKVSFADMNGLDLAHIKIITERPDCPPRWSQEFLDQVTGGAQAEPISALWELTFAQPSSNYMGWKTKLERDYVALENIVIKEMEGIVSGTIKVRNISFHKEVKVRFTSTSWAIQEEVLADYRPSATAGSSYDIYDSFVFCFPLPTSSVADKVEFCIQFTSDGREYWDNHDNKNYTLVSFRSKGKKSASNEKPPDLYGLEMDSWSEFSAWQHLENSEAPYW